MIFVDALLRIFDFVRAMLLAGQVPQDNTEGTIYNALNFLLNLFAAFFTF